MCHDVVPSFLEHRSLFHCCLLQLLVTGKATAIQAGTFTWAAETMRDLLQAYFDLEDLYIDYVHLVCRSSNQGLDGREDKPSHEVGWLSGCRIGNCNFGWPMVVRWSWVEGDF